MVGGAEGEAGWNRKPAGLWVWAPRRRGSAGWRTQKFSITHVAGARFRAQRWVRWGTPSPWRHLTTKENVHLPPAAEHLRKQPEGSGNTRQWARSCRLAGPCCFQLLLLLTQHPFLLPRGGESSGTSASVRKTNSFWNLMWKKTANKSQPPKRCQVFYRLNFVEYFWPNL